MAGKQNMFSLAQLGASSSQRMPSLSRHHSTHTRKSSVGPYPSMTTSEALTSGERIARQRDKRRNKTPTPAAGPSSIIPSSSMSPADESMLSGDESSDSEVVRKTLHYSGPQIPTPSDPRMLSTLPPAQILPNVSIDASTYDIDSPMHPPSHVEVPPPTTTSIASESHVEVPSPTTTSVASESHVEVPPPTTTSIASEPNTVNQPASAALQRLHNYIDSQLINLVGAAVEQAVGTRYNQLAETISEEIMSIKNQVLFTQDEDDPMQHDPPNDNSADGDDESEGNNGNHRDRQNRRKAADTKGKNNLHKRRQTADNDEEEEDEDDDGANHIRRRKAPTVLVSALRAFLQRKGLMVAEVLGLPNEPLPPCAPTHEVQHFNSRITRTGPDPFKIQYYWPAPLGLCKWNKQATAHLAREYHDLFQEGKILHNGEVLPYDSTISIKDFEKKIRIKLQRTQSHWKNANRPQDNSPHNTDDPAIPLSALSELASLRLKEARRRRRGAQLLEKRKRVAERYISDQQLKEQVLVMLESLGNGGMNYPLSDSEDSIDKELQHCEHFWLSTEILHLFEVLDLIERRARNSKLKTRRGNRPLRINKKPAKRVLDSPVTPSLPKNWYREEWYTHLDLYEKTDLDAAKIKALPDIQKIREIIEG